MINIPTTYKEFERWRKRQAFATPELDALARLVGNDLRLLEGPSGDIQGIQDAAAKLRAEFENKLAAFW